VPRIKAILASSIATAMAVIVWYARAPAADSNASAQRASAPVALPAALDRDLEPVSPKAAQPIQAVSVSIERAQPTGAVDEHLLMNRLRELGDSAPFSSLQMARQGNRLFPDSPEAAERHWYVCKSLVNLENFAEARDEARAMVAAYPGTPWANDVQRHLLVNPLDLPGDPAP